MKRAACSDFLLRDMLPVTLTLVALTVGPVGSAVAQTDNLPWGVVPHEHIHMDVYPADSSAAAVILGSYGDLYIGEDLTMTFDVHRRVKLLSEAGYHFGEVEISFVHRNGAQRLQSLEAQTLVPDGRGALRRVELHRSDVHREVDGERTRVRFTMPALEPGAIVEYRYQIASHRTILIPSWTFQSSEPTIWSEYRARFPAFLVFRGYKVGDPAFDVEEIEGGALASRPTGQYRSGTRVSFSTFRWVMTHIPAIRPERYTASIWNHAYAVRFDLTGYYDRHNQRHRLSDTWEDLAARLMDSGSFGRLFRPRRGVVRQVETLTADATGPRDRLEAIYDFVRSSMVWDGRFRPLADRAPDEVLELRSGTSAEVNLLLLAMLRAADIQAEPILVSTRANGLPIDWFASLLQFNHVIVRAQIGRDSYLLDGTDRHLPMGTLPVAALNDQGWLVSEDRLGWVPLRPAGGSMSGLDLSMTIDADGTVSGTVAGRLADYEALSARHAIGTGASEEERAKALVGEQFDFVVSDVAVDGLDGDGSITYGFHLEAPGHGRPMAHLMTFNPLLLQRLEANPFVAEDRTYPVEVPYPYVHSYTAEFAIPEGYEVEELPPSVRLALPGNAAAYQRLVSRVGDGIRVQRTFNFRTTSVNSEHYANLREFFEQVAAADAQVIVLARSDEAPVGSVPQPEENR